MGQKSGVEGTLSRVEVRGLRKYTREKYELRDKTYLSGKGDGRVVVRVYRVG